MGLEENPGAQDCYNLQLECPNHSINTDTLQYFQLSPNNTANDLPEAFHTGFDALKAQAGNSTHLISRHPSVYQQVDVFQSYEYQNLMPSSTLLSNALLPV